MASTFCAVILLLVLTLELNPSVTKVQADAGEPKRSKCTDDDATWSDFKQRFNRTYANCTEETKRLQLLTATRNRIAAHNADAAKGLYSYTLALNDLSDATDAEYKARLGFREQASRNSRRKRATVPVMPPYKNTIAASLLPASVDWRTLGWVSPIANQGRCGSCWAYAVTGAIESQFKNKTKTLVQLSQQNLISCSSDPSTTSTGNQGCNGGNPLMAYNYVRMYGQQLASTYPPTSYSTGVTGGCLFVPAKSVVKLASPISWNTIEQNELAIQQAIAKVGPVVVAIDAGSASFQSYASGIYNGPCTTNLNHAVQIVGYGTTAGQPYWIIKNSWGPYWGMSGYMLMARNVNMCGIKYYGSFPLVGTAVVSGR